MDAPDWSLQRDLIRLLVKRVEVDHDEINVVFHVAPPPASLPPGPEGGRSWQDCWRGDLAAAGECLPALCLRSLGRALATAGGHGRHDHRALCGRYRDRLRTRSRYPPLLGRDAQTA